MNEEIITSCFQLITYVGTARSCFINAIQCAKEGKYDEAADMIKQGDDAFVQGHHVHSDLAEKENKGILDKVGLLLLHAEDQLMSAEGFRTIADEFIAVYKRLDGAAPAVKAPSTETPAAEKAETANAVAEVSGNSFRYVIQDALGIHARPAGKLSKLAKELDSTITIAKVGGGSTKATKTMALMTLGVKGGDTVVVTVEGGSEAENLREMEKFFKENL